MTSAADAFFRPLPRGKDGLRRHGKRRSEKNVYTSEKVCYNNLYHAVVGGSHGITRQPAVRAARFSGRLPAFKQLTHTSAGRSRRYGAGCKLRSVCGFALPKYGAGPEKHPFVRCSGREYQGSADAISSARFGGSFPPIPQFEKFEIHKVFLHLSSLDLTKNLSPGLLAELREAAP